MLVEGKQRVDKIKKREYCMTYQGSSTNVSPLRLCARTSSPLSLMMVGVRAGNTVLARSAKQASLRVCAGMKVEKSHSRKRRTPMKKREQKIWQKLQIFCFF